MLFFLLFFTYTHLGKNVKKFLGTEAGVQKHNEGIIKNQNSRIINYPHNGIWWNGAQAWALTKDRGRKVQVVHRRMEQIMLGVSKKVKIRNTL